MTPLYIVSVFLAAIASASPVVEFRQTFPDTQALKTLQVTKVDWQQNNSTINGVRFQATLASTGETWSCSSSDSANSTEGFAPTKIERCAKGSPITFTWDNQNGDYLRIWLTTGDKSYAGSVAINPPSADNKVMSLDEIEVTPTTTPDVDL